MFPIFVYLLVSELLPYTPSSFEGGFLTAPVVQWQRHLPGDRMPAASNSEFGRPLVIGGDLLLGANGGTALFVLDRANGSLKGSFEAKAAVRSEPISVDGDVVFSDGAGYTRRYKLDGTLVWENYAGAPVLSKPTYKDGVIYIIGLDSVAHALDAVNGEIIWRYRHPSDRNRESDLELYGAPPVVLADGTVLSAFHDGMVVGLSKTGEPIWNVLIGEGRYPDLIGEPLISDNTAYLGGFTKPFVALDLETHEISWSLDFGVASKAVIEGETLFVGGTDGKLRALDRMTGAILWEWDSETSGALTEPQKVSAGLLVGSSDGSLWLIDSETGNINWVFDNGAELSGISAAPVVNGRQAFIVTNAGNLISLISPAKAEKPASNSYPDW